MEHLKVQDLYIATRTPLLDAIPYKGFFLSICQSDIVQWDIGEIL